MNQLLPVPEDWDVQRMLKFSKREMTKRIFLATTKLNRDVPEFDRYWITVPNVQRDLFIANLVEEIFAE